MDRHPELTGLPLSLRLHVMYVQMRARGYMVEMDPSLSMKQKPSFNKRITDRVKHLNPTSPSKRGTDAMDEDINDPRFYSHKFSEIETLHRALMMQRLVQDPFYATMNVTPAARKWMLRHLPHLAEHADHRYHINLMQFFTKYLGREEMMKFLRYKSAPIEIIEIWDKMLPPGPHDDGKPQAYKETLSDKESEEDGISPKKRHI